MRYSQQIQRLVRSRVARIALAVTLIAVSAWAFLPYIGYRVSTSAFVNTELVRITAPIAGRLTRDLPRKGDFIERPATVTLIESLSRDQRHLLDLGSQYAVAKERADLAKRQLAEIAEADREFEKRARTYRDGMVERLGHERDETKAEKTGCLAEAQQRREVGSRMERLTNAGLASQIRTAEALATKEAASTRCDMAAARLERLEAELASAQVGVFLRDGANDAPYSQQQRDRLLLRRQDLETHMLEENLRATQLAKEMTEERDRLDRLGHFDLSLPTDHVVWSVAASPGATVSEGQTVLDLAVCKHRFVVVELPERAFEEIRSGDPAYVRLVGSDDWRQGQIRQVRGSAARVDDRLLAAQVPKPDPNSIVVEVSLPEDEMQTDRNNFCNIGRLAEVRFQRTGLGLVGFLGKKLEQFARSFDYGSAPKSMVRN